MSEKPIKTVRYRQEILPDGSTQMAVITEEKEPVTPMDDKSLKELAFTKLVLLVETLPPSNALLACVRELLDRIEGKPIMRAQTQQYYKEEIVFRWES